LSATVFKQPVGWVQLRLPTINPSRPMVGLTGGKRAHTGLACLPSQHLDKQG